MPVVWITIPVDADDVLDVVQYVESKNRARLAFEFAKPTVEVPGYTHPIPPPPEA